MPGEEWTLQRAYAFEVQPFDGAEPEHGALKITVGLRRILDKVLKKTEAKKHTVVSLNVDHSTRTSIVREAVMEFAFAASPAEARSAAERLALKLCKSMDHRSRDGLFMIICRTHRDEADVQMMLFPREDVVRLKKGAGAASESVVNLLEDAFSAGRHVRKVTAFRGKALKTSFLKAEVIDWQVAGAGRDAADYWIAKFLDGRLFLNAQKGSELLARGLRLALEAAEDDSDRDVVFAETVLAGRGRIASCSLAEFSERLPLAVREAFLSTVDAEVVNLEFHVEPNVVRRLAGRRSVESSDGVRLSAPHAAFGRSVTIEERRDGERIVTYKGIVAKERVERE